MGIRVTWTYTVQWIEQLGGNLGYDSTRLRSAHNGKGQNWLAVKVFFFFFLMSEGLGKERIRMKTFTKLQEQPGYQESVSHIPTQSQTIWLLAKEDQCFAIELVNMNLEFSIFFLDK